MRSLTMPKAREVSSAEATAFLRKHDKMNVFKTGSVAFYIMVGALQYALATAPGPRKRSTVVALRTVSAEEAAKALRLHDRLKVLRIGQIGYDTGVMVVQSALAYTGEPDKPTSSAAPAA
jgi:hypothetical protein